MNLVTASQMREIEARAADVGLTSQALMQQAGESVARYIVNCRPAAVALILSGPGNNGEDGLVCAERLRERGLDVHVYGYARRGVAEAWADAIAADGDRDASLLRALLDKCDVVVDALLGTGQNRAPDDVLQRVIDVVNERSSQKLVVSVDVPTGVEADTGRTLGRPIRADATICMGALKPGVVVYPGAECSGSPVVEDLSLPPRLFAESTLFWTQGSDVASLLPRRSAESNKGTYGRVLVVGGSKQFVGAPSLVSLAAYRVGAGLVEVVTPDVVQEIVAQQVLECIFAAGTRPGDSLTAESLPHITQSLPSAGSVAFGPGMGSSQAALDLTRAFLQSRVQGEPVPAVIDADGLNNLSKIDNWWEGQTGIVLTPHPGEMSRLTGASVADVQGNRLEIAQQHARRWGQIVVLKGARTLVAAPDGRVAVNSTGGPNLATAGTGDVLSGTISGLLAQGLGSWESAVAGVYLHGLAGDIVAERLGQSGTLARDLTDTIPLARQSILAT